MLPVHFRCSQLSRIEVIALSLAQTVDGALLRTTYNLTLFYRIDTVKSETVHEQLEKRFDRRKYKTLEPAKLLPGFFWFSGKWFWVVSEIRPTVSWNRRMAITRFAFRLDRLTLTLTALLRAIASACWNSLPFKGRAIAGKRFANLSGR
jgi:hypothetical protein